jgi:predicted helicase
LVARFAPSAGWTLIPEQRLPNGRRPDATLRDRYTLARGYWEAKDTADDLDAQIHKKITEGYPTLNTIFEDTRRAVLYQDSVVVLRVDLSKRSELAELLTFFFSYAQPQIESFEVAARKFKEQIPGLAKRLNGLITAEWQDQRGNPEFKRAFTGFWTLCSQSIDSKITPDAVIDMLVQHLLTERLFRTVFNNPDFTRKNVIACEIETVVDALTSHVIDRNQFEQPLDPFYRAVEEAAKTLTDWSEKQAFMNMVYERFFQGYSVKDADTHGIVYTPQEIVDFMCASVEEELQREFGTSLSDPGVQILDPCTGTGNFIVNLIRRISGESLERKYREDLFANEIMLLPYYIASLNIEHAYYELTQRYESFEGICFVDTLEIAGRVAHEGLGERSLWINERNAERVEREKDAKIVVVIGNPPYNAKQNNDNDNNRNRRYEVIDGRIRDTYARDSEATSKIALADAYVKFFRWAVDRLEGRDGVVCFVSNNSFVDQIAFDGMRKHLLEDFTHIYHLDLHGNVRKNPKLSGTTHNVFGIQVGVGITVAVRSSRQTKHTLYYHRVPEDWRREQKLASLRDVTAISGVDWHELQPNERHVWLTQSLRPEFESFIPFTHDRSRGTEGVFSVGSSGLKTSRDPWAYSFRIEALGEQMRRFIEAYNAEVDRWRRRGSDTRSVDDFVNYDDKRIKWSDTLRMNLTRERYGAFDQAHIRSALYRPFVGVWLYFDRLTTERVYQMPEIFPTPATEKENKAILITGVGSMKPFSAFASDRIPDMNFYADPIQCFPMYTYNEDGTGHRENVTEWALEQFQARYGPDVTRRDIFAYVYGVLHHPQYREQYAENLKRELPRIPLVPNRAQFEALCQAGYALLKLHLTYEQAKEYSLRTVETPGESTNWHVTKMRLSPDKTGLKVNGWLTLDGIPAETFEYRLGNRSALDWVVDQYQVSIDARSGITSDPNRADDPQFIVRLVKQVVTVSVETVALVRQLEQKVSLDSVTSK